jgi:nucleoside-diphosphate-sugar epimerase
MKTEKTESSAAARPRQKIVVTGGSGKAGRACVQDLLAHGYVVFNVDTATPSNPICPSIVADLRDFGETMDALTASDGAFDAVVHLAAIPAPRLRPDGVTFANNMLSTYNIFEAARRLGINNVVWASSETVLGLPFEKPPAYVPVDEAAPARPESAYSLSKLLGEEMAVQFCRWNPDTKIIGLRFSNVMEPADYDRFPSFEDDISRRKWNLWNYIDARDAAQAIRLALESPLRGAQVFIIAAEDTVMTRPTSALLSEAFPGVPVNKNLSGNEAPFSIEKACRLLGFAPKYGWRSRSQS